MDNLYIDNLSGQEFEEYLLKLFEKLGYKGEVTQASNDYGADLIVTRDNEKIVVQAKRYKNTVGISAVQEVIGAKKYYGATKTMVATNNYFTPNAIKLAKLNNVELWDRDSLIQMAILSISPTNDVCPAQVDNTEVVDELLDVAINTILDKEIASISYLQRSLRVGFNRASRLMDSLEALGIVSSDEGSKPRRVLITREQYENVKTDDNKHTSGQGAISKYSPRKVRLILSFILFIIISSFTIVRVDSITVSLLLSVFVVYISFKLATFTTNIILKENKPL